MIFIAFLFAKDTIMLEGSLGIDSVHFVVCSDANAPTNAGGTEPLSSPVEPSEIVI